MNKQQILHTAEYWRDRTGKATVAYTDASGNVHYQIEGWPIAGQLILKVKA